MKLKLPHLTAALVASLVASLASLSALVPAAIAAYGPIAAPGLSLLSPPTPSPTREAPSPKAEGAGARSIPHQCFLFTDGVQEVSGPRLELAAYRPYFADCHIVESRAPSAAGSLEQVLVAYRRFSVRGQAYYLLVQPETLETEILKASCLSCEERLSQKTEAQSPAASVETGVTLVRSRLSRALDRHTAPPAEGPRPIENDGLRAADEETEGSFLTGDLCPSHKAMDRSFFEKIQRLDPVAPIGLAVSGYWVGTHRDDFHWLKERVHRGLLKITWVNHSYSHPYKEGEPLKSNFLLKPNVNLEREVLETERVLIAGGVTPSVFFRTPGLVSDDRVIEGIKRLGLIPLGAEAWLAKGQKAKNGSVILVHVNGNEPYGLSLFDQLVSKQKLPLPLLPLTLAPAR